MPLLVLLVTLDDGFAPAVVGVVVVVGLPLISTLLILPLLFDNSGGGGGGVLPTL
jgi:hypothetical protein